MYPGKHTSIKNANSELHHNKVSKHTNCPFQIIVQSPNRIAPAWYISTIKTTHNDHTFKTGTLEFN